MKKITGILLLAFLIFGLLMGCQSRADTPNKKDDGKKTEKKKKTQKNKKEDSKQWENCMQ